MTESTLNSLFSHRLVWLAWIVVPPVVLCLSLMILERRPLFIRILSSLLFAIASLLFCFSTPLLWGGRDGMGPNSVESHGPQAVSLFMDGFVSMTETTVAIIGFSLFLCFLPFSRRRK